MSSKLRNAGLVTAGGAVGAATGGETGAGSAAWGGAGSASPALTSSRTSPSAVKRRRSTTLIVFSPSDIETSRIGLFYGKGAHGGRESGWGRRRILRRGGRLAGAAHGTPAGGVPLGPQTDLPRPRWLPPGGVLRGPRRARTRVASRPRG